jgi:molybdopterin-guanine dinucleotide biosynthesis protein A
MSERNDHVVADALNHPVGSGAVLGVIFAGGASRRYGDDKALAELGGAYLLQRVVDRIQPQVSALAISGEKRAGFVLPTIPDELQGAGPLAALRSVLVWAEQHEFALAMTVSCDTPFIPRNIVSVLHAALKDFDCAVVIRAGMAHPTCALWKTAARTKVETAFESGARSLHGAIDHLNAYMVDFSAARDGPGDDPFFNINSKVDMAMAQAWLDNCHVPK